MFKKLFSWWHENILLKQALEQSAAALEKAGEMFSFAMSFLIDGVGEEKKIYDMDQEVNAMQIDIRKKVLEHLTISPEQDVTASLVLITIVVDIERIGDYAKNLIELHQMGPGKLESSRYVTEIKNIRAKIEAAIPATIEAFIDADADKAKSLLAEFVWVGHKCDSVLQSLVGDDSLSVREAVVYGLLFRYLKRIGAHLKNVSSSVVNPFHRLGYRPD
jgi:phosphate transport system protein